MIIVADENIPLAVELFGVLGNLRLYPGRSINAERLTDADVLLVRSVTQVDASLLDGTRVKFVGSATIGVDHLDTDYLDQQGIGYCNAPGCNAQSVVEYVISVLSVLSEQKSFKLTQKSVGIIGKGQIGGRLYSVLQKMGVKVVANDPPKQQSGDDNLYDLDTILACDIISVHVPLTTSGHYPTYNLLAADKIEHLRENQILINTSRGNVIDETAMLARLRGCESPTVVLDVFAGEPEINVELAKHCHFATPHIAGYSLEGRTNGAEMIYRQLCHYTGLPVRLNAQQFLPDPALQKLVFSSTADDISILNTAIRAVYDVRADDAALRNTFDLEPVTRSLKFDRLRKYYPQRRSFAKTMVSVPGHFGEARELLSAAGFLVSEK